LKGMESRIEKSESSDESEQELPAPGGLNAPKTDESDSSGAGGIEAGYRMRWSPQFARET
jgi:hypothetical protein